MALSAPAHNHNLVYCFLSTGFENFFQLFSTLFCPETRKGRSAFSCIPPPRFLLHNQTALASADHELIPKRRGTVTLHFSECKGQLHTSLNCCSEWRLECEWTSSARLVRDQWEERCEQRVVDRVREAKLGGVSQRSRVQIAISSHHFPPPSPLSPCGTTGVPSTTTFIRLGLLGSFSEGAFPRALIT